MIAILAIALFLYVIAIWLNMSNIGTDFQLKFYQGFVLFDRDLRS